MSHEEDVTEFEKGRREGAEAGRKAREFVVAAVEWNVRAWGELLGEAGAWVAGGVVSGYEWAAAGVSAAYGATRAAGGRALRGAEAWGRSLGPIPGAVVGGVGAVVRTTVRGGEALGRAGIAAAAHPVRTALAARSAVMGGIQTVGTVSAQAVQAAWGAVKSAAAATYGAVTYGLGWVGGVLGEFGASTWGLVSEGVSAAFD